MKNQLLNCLLLLGFALSPCVSSPVSADELRYKPINPAFGGNPFNGPYLLNNASEQKQFSPPTRKRPTAIENFSEGIQRSLVSQISRDIADQILGENPKDSGSFTVGDTQLDFKRVDGQVVIDVKDSKTGGQTTIELPVPQY